MQSTNLTSPNTNTDITASADADKAVGRVVIEMTASGVLYIEQYINGQRQRTMLDRGQEHWQIIDALHEQRRRAKTDAERKQAAREAASVARHNRVFNHANQNHGFEFAVTRIGGKIPLGYKSAPGATEFGHYLNAPTQKQLAQAVKAKETNLVVLDDEAEFL